MIRLKKSILFATAILISISAMSQSRRSSRVGNINITGDVAVSKLIEKHIEFNEKVTTIPGYRIQIASLSGSNSKQKAFALKSSFQNEFPEVEVYIIFDEPNFKVKVGDFRTRLEAYGFLQKIKSYHDGYIIQDNINPVPPTWDDLVPETDADAEY